MLINGGGVLDVRYVDPNFVKLFQISQLIIEYLLHSQDYLNEHREKLVEECDGANKEMEMIKVAYDKEAIELKNLRKENRALRKTVYAYQLMVKVPGEGTKGAVTIPAYHYERREEYPDKRSRQPSPQPNVKGGVEVIEKVTETMERFSSRIVEVERQIKNEMEIKLQRELSERQARLEDGYRQERLRYEKDLQELKEITSINQQMERERASFIEERAELERLLVNTTLCPSPILTTLPKKKSKALEAKRSHIGRLEDDTDDDKAHERDRDNQKKQAVLQKRLEAEQKEAIQKMKDEFQREVDEIRKAVSKDATRDKKRLETKLEEATRHLSELQDDLERERRRNFERESDIHHSLRSLEADFHHSERRIKEEIWNEKGRMSGGLAGREEGSLEGLEKRMEVKVEKKMLEEYDKPRESVKVKEAAPEKIVKLASPKPLKVKIPKHEDNLDSDMESPSPVPLSNAKPAKVASPKVERRTPKTDGRLWAFLDSHSETPIPKSPWIRTLFPHTPESFDKVRGNVKNLLAMEMENRGIFADDIIELWGHLDVEAKFQSKLTKLYEEITKYEGMDPLRREFKDVVLDDIDRIMDAEEDGEHAHGEHFVDEDDEAESRDGGGHESEDERFFTPQTAVAAPPRTEPVVVKAKPAEPQIVIHRPSNEQEPRSPESDMRRSSKVPNGPVQVKEVASKPVVVGPPPPPASGAPQPPQTTSVTVQKVSSSSSNPPEVPKPQSKQQQTLPVQTKQNHEERRDSAKPATQQQPSTSTNAQKPQPTTTRSINTIHEETDERNDRRSNDSFDVSEMSQLSEPEADSWSETSYEKKRGSGGGKGMDRSSKQLAGGGGRNKVNATTNNLDFDSMSDFDSNSESFGGTKIPSKSSHHNSKQHEHGNSSKPMGKQAAFASTANGPSFQGSYRKFDNSDSDLSMEMA
ncbi:Zinc finger protein dzip1 [Phlyctochytrium planicorne]|nr:Zinc finger protein dzip1 [Phlyctochytrium planicorne]